MKLHILSIESISFGDLIQSSQAYLGESSVGLMYSLNWCGFVTVEANSGRVTNSEGWTPDAIFEARIFNSDYELRWLNIQTGIGKGAILSETALIPDAFTEAGADVSVMVKDMTECHDMAYLLWGSQLSPQASLPEGWSALGAQQIGTLPIPIPTLPKQGRVYLKTVEYFQEYDHGNVGVAEERLIQLQHQS